MITKKGICKDCGRNTNICNKKYNLCFQCNSRRLYIEKQKKNREQGIQPYMSLYNEIWNERKHVCEITGQDLECFKNTDFYRNMFMHVFAKGKFPKYSHLKINIMLVHPEVHYLYDSSSNDKLLDYIGEDGINLILNRKKEILAYEIQNM